MRRTERLFQIIQILRAKRGAVTGAQLADELGVSLRSLYRDMAELIAQRVPREGGRPVPVYVLDDGYDMPPLMLTPDELEGPRFWARHGWRSEAIRLWRGALAISSPKSPNRFREPCARCCWMRPLRPISMKPIPVEELDISAVRRAVRDRFKILITYENGNGSVTSRRIWRPIFIALHGGRSPRRRLVAN